MQYTQQVNVHKPRLFSLWRSYKQGWRGCGTGLTRNHWAIRQWFMAKVLVGIENHWSTGGWMWAICFFRLSAGSTSRSNICTMVKPWILGYDHPPPVRISFIMNISTRKTIPPVCKKSKLLQQTGLSENWVAVYRCTHEMAIEWNAQTNPILLMNIMPMMTYNLSHLTRMKLVQLVFTLFYIEPFREPLRVAEWHSQWPGHSQPHSARCWPAGNLRGPERPLLVALMRLGIPKLGSSKPHPIKITKIKKLYVSVGP
jgi:hypothetical protein